MHPGGGRGDRIVGRTLADHGGNEREQSNDGEHGDAIGPSVAAGWLPKSVGRDAHIEALLCVPEDVARGSLLVCDKSHTVTRSFDSAQRRRAAGLVQASPPRRKTPALPEAGGLLRSAKRRKHLVVARQRLAECEEDH